MSDLATIVANARAEFDGCADAAALENAKAKYLGKSGALTELLKGLGKLSAAERPAAGAAINEAKQDLEAALAARRAALADAKLATPARRGRARRVAARTRPRRRHAAPAVARAGARGDAVPFARLRSRRRPGDRGRLPQLHRAQHAREPPCPVDAGHVLRRRRHGAAHAHVADPGAVHGNPRAADQDHRARPRLPRGQRRDALADVPPGRGPVDRPATSRSPTSRARSPSSCGGSSSATT